MDYKGNWWKVFGNHQKLHIELGMGKGKFIIEMAERHPEINFIGIEKYDSVLARAIEKIEFLPNLRFIRMNANLIDQVFDHEISKIYLNFSDPWPKKRHAERRLTSPTFLEKYSTIFKDSWNIEQKTDNADFFEYSLLSFLNAGWHLEDFSVHLYRREDLSWNVSTEYEDRFCEKGLPIYYAHFKKINK